MQSVRWIHFPTAPRLATIMIKLLLAFSIFLLQGCVDEKEMFHRLIQGISSEEVTRVEFSFPEGLGGKVQFIGQHDIETILDWMGKATSPRIASYPDALVPVAIVLRSEASVKFNISVPTPTIHYVVIKWEGRVFIAPPFPKPLLSRPVV